MRLTEEIKNNNATDRKYRAINTSYYNSPLACANKLGPLENIEDNLGIGLQTFVDIVFNAEDNCFVKNGDEIERAEIVSFSKDNNEYYVDLRIYSNTEDEDGNPARYWFRHYNFKDYRKTWALTAEDFE